MSELGEQASGDIIDQHGKVIGEHDGAIYYTVGQRHGLNVGGGLPYYVTHKDMKQNIVYVTTDLNDGRLWSKSIELTSTWWINQAPKERKDYQVKCRYRSPSVGCQLEVNKESARVELTDEVRAISPGQSAVIYDGEVVVGGGIIQSGA